MTDLFALMFVIIDIKLHYVRKYEHKRLLPGSFWTAIFYTQGGIFVFWYKLSREMIEKRRKNSGKSVLLKDL